MTTIRPLPRILLALCLAAWGAVVGGCATAVATPAVTPAGSGVEIPALVLTYLGEARLAHGHGVTFPMAHAPDILVETTVGGLSALAFDPVTERFLALSDGPGTGGPARGYLLTLGLEDGVLETGEAKIVGAFEIRDENDAPFTKDALDPEGLALHRHGAAAGFYLSSEGNAPAGVPPFVGVLSPDGRLLERFPLPEDFHPTAASGVRANLAFEPLALSPDGTTLWTGTESALVQDGPEATLSAGAIVRLVRYDLDTGTADRQVRYPLDPIIRRPLLPGGFKVNGLVELLVLADAPDHGRLLALERSFSVGSGNSVRLYDVTWSDDLEVAEKTLVLDLSDLGVHIDNLEGMTWGPTLADGRRTLVMVSDDNFLALQRTQFLAFAVESPPRP